MHIAIRDNDKSAVARFKEVLGSGDLLLPDGDTVSVACCGIFSEPADAVVSPANSFGFMGGGIDAVYWRRWPKIQDEVQHRIMKHPFGELLVGQAMVVSTGEVESFRRMIVAPTMRVPMEISALNVYLATRAAIREAMSHQSIKILAMPGMGTGCGGVPAATAAGAMLRGIRHALTNYIAAPRTWYEEARLNDDGFFRKNCS